MKPNQLNIPSTYTNIKINSITYIVLSFIFLSCNHIEKKPQPPGKEYHDIVLSKSDTTDYLIRTSPENPNDESDVPFAFLNQNGDTIIQSGTYDATWTDTLKTFAIVWNKTHDMIGIDRKGNILFEVFRFDNGPDYIAEGLFRVLRNGKIGYANMYGEVVIPCQYDCAYYFENGKAKVSKNCSETKDGEYHEWVSESWYFIDKNGNSIE